MMSAVHVHCTYGPDEQIINFLKIYGLLWTIEENQNYLFFNFLFNEIGFRFLRQKFRKCIPFLGTACTMLKQYLSSPNDDYNKVTFSLPFCDYEHLFSKLNDPLDIKLQTCVVYKISCKNFEQVYIGETKTNQGNNVDVSKCINNTALCIHMFPILKMQVSILCSIEQHEKNAVCVSLLKFK